MICAKYVLNFKKDKSKFSDFPSQIYTQTCHLMRFWDYIQQWIWL